MPQKQRRTRAELRTRQKVVKGSSSNEEMDSCSAQEIVAKLANKYLLKSSTDTENEKENSKKKQKVFDPYDADLEYSTTDMESQNSACEMETNSKKNSKRGPKKQPAQRKTTKGKQNSQPKQPTKTLQSGFCKKPGQITYKKRMVGWPKSSSTDCNTQSDASNPNRDKTRIYKKENASSSEINSMDCEALTFSPESQNSDVGDGTKEQCSEKKSRKESIRCSDYISMECGSLSLQSPPDSGFYVTPPTKSGHFSFLPKLPASDTSTPASTRSGKNPFDDSCFGFENIGSPEPLLISPVVPLTSNTASSYEGSIDKESFQMSSREVSSSISESKSKRSKNKRPLELDVSLLCSYSSEDNKKMKKPKVKPTSNTASSFECSIDKESFQMSSREVSSSISESKLSKRSKNKRPLELDVSQLCSYSSEDNKKIKKPKVKPKKDFTRLEALMNAEFDDVEMHELTIES
ncbi:uncharacterized protein [Antedon mediterranea]|uniref:uncharacterized protein n=1 Tax=Antedon mediterranea TaxID=105859 RepID=UPI003AF785B9